MTLSQYKVLCLLDPCEHGATPQQISAWGIYASEADCNLSLSELKSKQLNYIYQPDDSSPNLMLTGRGHGVLLHEKMLRRTYAIAIAALVLSAVSTFFAALPYLQAWLPMLRGLF